MDTPIHPDFQVMNPDANLCGRCEGSGRYGRHGKCFACNGTGTRAVVRQAVETFEREHADAVGTIRGAAERNAFCRDLVEKLGQYGSLSPRQLDAGVGAARRAVADAAASANSRHVGELGERRVFDLTLVRLIELPPDERFYPARERWVCLFNDAAGNRIVYFGATGLFRMEAGDTVRIKATVKAHSDRDGVAQTIINRPAEAK
jgi:hypothetical protein